MTGSNSGSRLLPGGFAPAVAALLLGFGVSLYHLACFALSSELYSYILLVPPISLCLVWFKRADLPPPSPPQRTLAALLLAAGAAIIAGYCLSNHFSAPAARQDSLFLTSLSFVLMFAGICSWFLGRRTVRAIAFPLAFLGFMAPLPLLLANSLITFFQNTSAAVAYEFFNLAGMPVFQRDNLNFQLPGVSLEVAPQCSGINSSLALLIVSLSAGYILLRSPWKRAVLALAVLPLGILRNGFRIFTIGELCVRVGPQMINSYIHRTGGWMFFLLSLAPLFILLFLLSRSELPSAGESAKPLRV